MHQQFLKFNLALHLFYFLLNFEKSKIIPTNETNSICLPIPTTVHFSF